ncbi:WD40/YVTN/BNR-like repeat-containing protein [Symbiobacterium thermophilum]|nr:YCF48-related protein [Symbiobacterium thermophilum]
MRSDRFAVALMAVIVAVLAPGCEAGDRSAPIPSVPVAAAFLDERHGWIGAADGIWYTDDGGRKWTHQFPSQEAVIRLGFVDPQNGWALTQSSAALRTQNGGADWITLDVPGASLRAVDLVSPAHAVATDGNGLLVSRDGGKTWDRSRPPLPLADLDFVSEEEGWAAGEGQVWHTRDGGETWSAQLTLPEPDRWLGDTFVRFPSETSGWVLFCLGQGAAYQETYLLYGTTDGGRTWTPRLVGGWPWPFEAEAPEAPQGPGGYPVAFDARADTAWVAVYSPAAGHLEVVRVTLGGAPPVSSDKIPIEDPRKPTVGISFVDTETGWLVMSDSQQKKTAILRSDDGGTSWTSTIDNPR